VKETPAGGRLQNSFLLIFVDQCPSQMKERNLLRTYCFHRRYKKWQWERMLVSQSTLCSDCMGHRPSPGFSSAWRHISWCWDCSINSPTEGRSGRPYLPLCVKIIDSLKGTCCTVFLNFSRIWSTCRLRTANNFLNFVCVCNIYRQQMFCKSLCPLSSRALG
jgi:hypothetical protein